MAEETDTSEFDGDMDILNSVDDEDKETKTDELDDFKSEDDTDDKDSSGSDDTKIDEDEDTEDEKEDDDEDEEDDEDKEGDKDDKKDDEEEEEDVVEVGPKVTIKGIKEKFPEFFKSFPHVRDTLFYAESVRQHFPTMDDVKAASEVVDTYNQFESSIMQGNPQLILTALHKATDGEGKSVGPEILEKFALRFLPALGKISPETTGKIINPLIANVLRAAMKHAKQKGDKNLFLAGKYISNYFFDDPIPPEHKKIEKEEDPEKARLQSELRKRDEIAFNNYRGRIVQGGHEKLDKIIARMADPKKEFSEFTRSAIIERTKRAIIQRLDASPGHNKLMDSLWDRARRNGLSDEEAPRLISAFLGSAKQLLPGTIKRIRNEAQGRKNTKKKQLDNFQGGGVSRQPGGPRIPPKNTDWDKTSDLDAFSGNFKTKK